MHPKDGNSLAVCVGGSGRTGRVAEYITFQTNHDLPGLDHTDQWFETPGYPTDHYVETCTNHTGRTRSDDNVITTNPRARA